MGQAAPRVEGGDRDANDANLQTLNPLFPRGNYFTEAALLGPQNFFDVHPCLQLHPFPNWTFETGMDFYWCESLNDGIYTPGGSVIYRIRASLASSARTFHLSSAGRPRGILACLRVTRIFSPDSSFARTVEKT